MIPKIIFQIGPVYKQQYDVIKGMHPDYKYKFYNDSKCLDVLNKHGTYLEQRAYHSIITGASKADVCRLLVLKYKGGVYIETDVTLLKPIDTIHENLHKFSLFTGFHWPFEFVGCVPYHPIITRALEVQVSNTVREVNQLNSTHRCKGAHGCVIRVTGPLAYTSAIGDVTHTLSCKNKQRTPGPRDCLTSSNYFLRNMYICPLNSTNSYKTYSCNIARHWDCRNSGKGNFCAKKHYSKSREFFRHPSHLNPLKILDVGLKHPF